MNRANFYYRTNAFWRNKYLSEITRPKRKSNLFKDLNWSIFKTDLIRLLGRSYYLRMAILIAILDITVLIKIFKNIKLIWLTIPLTYISLKVILQFLANLTCIALNKHYKQSIFQQPRAQCSSGPPGCGKSSNEAWKVRELANQQWKAMQQEYWFYMSLNRSKLSTEKKADYDEVVNAYNFEMQHPNAIHCLWSNISIRDGKNHNLKSHKLTKDHLLQRKKLPYRAVLFTDEIGSMFPASKGPSTDETEKLSRLARWIRQFIEAFWTFTEQEFSKTFVDVRRVTGSNRYFKGQEWVLKPTLLIWLYNSLMSLILFPMTMQKYFKPQTDKWLKYERKLRRRAKIFAKPMKTFKRYISSIGWRHYQYVELGNSEVNVKNQDYDDKKGDSKTRHIYLESCLNCYYDDRAFRNAYDAIDFDLMESEFTSDKLTKNDILELFKKEKENDKE